MVSELFEREKRRERRILHNRKKIFGTTERPRISVFVSGKHFYAQVVDDTKGNTIVSASTLEFKDKIKKTWNIEAAKEVAKILAQRMIQKGIKKAVFDRRFRKYHGKLKAFADTLREGGVDF
ncbi:MAG: 50S ribosomal protein L18 [Candidatus Calescibacterium sp.]|nr:50S ribosomal protein L18 [Candidatus Calescibacterium sp.]MCX7734017.1 50S ribosomal protein L18 [bacterium]MDW8086384.1 50S ribosomal protein L18 [Candidatus Calescibacterium sp.]